jgi:hypothetical protein
MPVLQVPIFHRDGVTDALQGIDLQGAEVCSISKQYLCPTITEDQSLALTCCASTVYYVISSLAAFTLPLTATGTELSKRASALCEPARSNRR